VNPLDVWTISVIAGGGAGVLGGVAVNWLLDRDQRVTDDPVADPVVEIDPSVEARVRQGARDWARQHGRPGAEQLVASKLRLGLRLQQRRRGRDQRTRDRW
jgi:hypothetical protein